MKKMRIARQFDSFPLIVSDIDFSSKLCFQSHSRALVKSNPLKFSAKLQEAQFLNAGGHTPPPPTVRAMRIALTGGGLNLIQHIQPLC